MKLLPLDFIVIIGYFVLIAGAGLYMAMSRGKQTADDYFVADRHIPGWAVAFTLMGTLISTGTVVGHPGTAYQKGLILFTPHAILPIVLLIVAKYVVPFYRRVVRMSAYEYIGQRFGLGGRWYTAFGFVADRIFDIGVTFYTTSIAVSALTGWELKGVILAVGLFIVIYTMIGGLEAVVWTDVIQGVLLIFGGLFVLLRILFAPEAGAPGAVVAEAYHAGRLTLGSWDWSWNSFFNTENTTQWLFIGTFFINWCRRYITDQHMVQKYLIARTDKEASRGALWGALLCVPVFFIFMFTGACLYGFFALAHVPPPPEADKVMPYFLANYVPHGLLGLIVAALLAASLSSVSADLNSVSTVITADYFIYLLPRSSDQSRVRFGRAMVLVAGLLAAGIGIFLIPPVSKTSAPVMERAVTYAAILAGGTLGLFCLGFLTRQATRTGCYIGMACCFLFTTWAILTEPKSRIMDLGFNFNMNPILIGFFGHVVLFTTGYAASRLLGGYRPENVESLTFWSFRKAAVPDVPLPEAVAVGK
jgi:SSS family solute:Na+ symporter